MIDQSVITSLIFAAAGFGFVFFNLAVLGRILRGRSLPYAEKGSAYECGETVVGDARQRFNPRFFLIAIVFVIFDIEIAFLFPWAIAFKEAGPRAFFEMVLFLAILLVGYLWFWKIGELRWVMPEEREK